MPNAQLEAIAAPACYEWYAPADPACSNYASDLAKHDPREGAVWEWIYRAGVLGGIVVVLIALAGLIWRLSAWHTSLEDRLGQLEERLARVERRQLEPQSGRHRRVWP